MNLANYVPSYLIQGVDKLHAQGIIGTGIKIGM